MRMRLMAAAVGVAVAAVLALAGALALAAAHPSGVGQARCETARWAAGVLTGSGVRGLDTLKPTRTTVLELRSLATRPGRRTRASGAESTLYELRASLAGAQVDREGDIKLVVRGRSPADSMVVELPKVACATTPKARALIVQARRRFVAACGMPAAGAMTPLAGRARIRGLGFFGRLVGQAGTSPNGIELLPVTDFAPTSCSKGGAVPPTPPTPYRVPSGAIVVSSSKQLKAALASAVSRDIVLRNGTYDSAGPFLSIGGNRLWAKNLGGAVLRAGIALSGQRGAGGGTLRGLVFDVDDPAKVLEGSIVHVWGSARNTRIVDVRLEGHMVIGSGVFARQVEGLVVRRLVATHFRDFGVYVDKNALETSVARPPLVEDVYASDVTRPVARSSNGTAEACVWIGNTATVRRVEVTRCAWEGLWSGTAARGAVFEDVTSYDNGIGVYLEHFNTDNTIRRLRVGPGVRVGVVCEWADPAWNRRPGCTDVVIEDSYFETRVAGVVLDEGTTRTTVRRSTFVGQCWAGIGDYRGVGNLWDTAANDFAALAPGAVPVSREHAYTGTCG